MLVVDCLTGGGEKGSPPPKSIAYFFMSRGFFGGRGIARRPLPHMYEGYFNDVGWRRDCTSGLPPHTAGLYLGGRGTGLLPHNFGDFLGGGRTGPPPHNVGEYFGGGGTGPPPHNVGEYFGGGGTGPPPHNAGMYLGGGGTGPPPHKVSEYRMPMTEEETRRSAAGRQSDGGGPSERQVGPTVDPALVVSPSPSGGLFRASRHRERSKSGRGEESPLTAASKGRGGAPSDERPQGYWVRALRRSGLLPASTSCRAALRGARACLLADRSGARKAFTSAPSLGANRRAAATATMGAGEVRRVRRRSARKAQ